MLLVAMQPMKPRATRAKRPASAASKVRIPQAAAAFPVVGIGASAGGLEAVTAVLQELPTDTGMGFVVVQHLDPQHESALTALLSRVTSMPVSEARNGKP